VEVNDSLSPEIPDFIPADLESAYQEEARRIVRRLTDGRTTSHGAGPGSGVLDTLYTGLVGLSITVAALTVALGMLFLWISVPWLAYDLIAAAAVTGLGWLFHGALVRRFRPGVRH
jgi:hypothetical protein